MHCVGTSDSFWTLLGQIYGALMSIHVAVGLVPVKRFNPEGLHQLQNPVLQLIKTYNFVTDGRPSGSKRFTGTRPTAT